MTPWFEPIQDASGVYIIVNLVNGNCYIGSSANIRKRVWSHLRCKKGSAIVATAIRKHGVENFEAHVLEMSPRAALPEREAWWMNFLRPEYNATDLTITGGRVLRDETKAKLRAANLGKRLTPEHRAAISAGGKGRVFDRETVERIRAANTGQKRSAESIEKMRAVKWTDERRNKISAAQIGRTQPAETRSKRSAALKGKPWSAARRAAEVARKNPDLGFIDKEYRA